MPQYIITPWRFPSELLQVRRELYRLGDSTAPVDDRRHAVNWVAAWKIRGNLPHAIESTAHLVDAVLHQEADNNSPFSVRATYAAAFCRFVTGFCDIQQNSFHKASMLEVARQIDMPASFVELRHEATHDQLPSLVRLSRNAKLALDWLWQYYWAKLDAIENTDSSTPLAKRRKKESSREQGPKPSAQELRSALTAFVAKRRDEIKSKSTNFSETSASGMAAVSLIQLCKGHRENLVVLAEVLVKEKMLIPAGRSLNSSMSGAFVIWDNLLRRMALYQRRFLHVLLSRMVHLLTQVSLLALQLDELREAVYLWLLHVFASPQWASNAIVKERVKSTREMVVNECIMVPNAWTARLARELVEHGEEEFRETWSPLVALLESDG